MQADSAAHSLPNSMAEMLGLERVGFNGNDIGEHDSVVEQLHRILRTRQTESQVTTHPRAPWRIACPTHVYD